VRQEHGVSERLACRTLKQIGSTRRKVLRGMSLEKQLTDDIIDQS